MEFVESAKEFAGRKKIIKVDANNVPIQGAEEILVNIVKDEGLGTDGTPINAENLNKGNWRDDDSVSFKLLSNNIIPPAKENEMQIVSKLNGEEAEVWVIRPDGHGNNFKIGDVSMDTLNAIKTALEIKTDDAVSAASVSAGQAAHSAANAEAAAKVY